MEMEARSVYWEGQGGACNELHALHVRSFFAFLKTFELFICHATHGAFICETQMHVCVSQEVRHYGAHCLNELHFNTKGCAGSCKGKILPSNYRPPSHFVFNFYIAGLVSLQLNAAI